MKNSIISIGLFACTMILVFFLNSSLIKLCDEVQEKANIIEETLLTDDFETAFDQSMELIDLLKGKNFQASIYITHEAFDELVDEAVRLSVFTQYKDSVDANASVHAIKNMAENMKNLQIATLENILVNNIILSK